ncbi:pentapeptide repeat-containing protein [Legionella clemsonensis]|uniref:Pentapeptide repeats (8 copies) n=1 Tax=Legionella clemsonensis TaxID=1867846 RepID=A0A222P6J0_9GAMM|nr:pentapeptide repeat-containing protein [Legionella clemsonensis]ASQ47466.1 Pentapeptide repeats (8 copies) [Legionella clemsonensis]
MIPIDSIFSGKELEERAKEISQEEKQLYQKFNQLFNESYDFSKSFAEQSSSFLLALTSCYEEIQQLNQKQVQLATQYFALSEPERELFWKNYSPDSNKKPSYEAFAALVDNSPKLNDAQKIKTKADALQLMFYETGTKMIAKTVDHVRNYVSQNNPNNKFSIIAEGYSIGMQSDNSMKPSPEAQQHVENFSWQNNFANFAEFKKLFRHPHNIKVKPSGILLLSVNETDDALYIFPGIESPDSSKIILFASPSYQSLYHELAHLNRAFRGSGKSAFSMPSLFRNLYSRDTEEIWNINLGKSSDNSLQKERKAPLRIAHSQGFTLIKKDTQLEVDQNTLFPNVDYVSTSLCNGEALFGRRDFSNLAPRDNQIIKLSLQGIKEKVALSNSTVVLSIVSSTLVESDFRNANLIELHASFSSLTRCNFDNVQIENGSFSKFCDLSASQFKGANLKGTVFRDCDLSHCNFNGADLSGVTFKGKIVGIETCCFDNALITDILSPTLQSLVARNEMSINNAIETEIKLSNLVEKLQTCYLADLNAILYVLNFFKKDETLIKMVGANSLTPENLVEFLKATGIETGAITLLQTKAVQEVFAQGNPEALLNILRQETHKTMSLEKLHAIFKLLGNSDVLTTLMTEKKLSLEQIHTIIKLDTYNAEQFFDAIHRSKAIRSALLSSAISVDAIIAITQQKKSSEALKPLDELDDSVISMEEPVTCKSVLIEEVKKLLAAQASQQSTASRSP